MNTVSFIKKLSGNDPELVQCSFSHAIADTVLSALNTRYEIAILQGEKWTDDEFVYLRFHVCEEDATMIKQALIYAIGKAEGHITEN